MLQSPKPKELPSKSVFLTNVIILGLLLTLVHCTQEYEVIKPARERMLLTTDTLDFDTLLTSQVSATKRIYLYNPHEHAIKIDKINQKANSPVTIYINGKKVEPNSQYVVLGKDSVTLMASALFNNFSNKSTYYNENLEIVTQSLPLHIHVKATVINTATPIYNITQNTTLDSALAYDIRQIITVNPGAVLTIQKGAHLYFKKNAGILVLGTIHAVGDSGKRITFEGPNPDKYYEHLPAQWQGIMIGNNSTGNKIQFCDIKNGEYGAICASTSELLLSHCRIHNMKSYGLFAENCNITIYNCLIYNTQNAVVSITGAGKYIFTNNTLANYTSFYGYTITRTYPLFQATNSADSKIFMTNNIIWGDRDNELIMTHYGKIEDISRNIIKSKNLTLTIDTSNYIDKDPIFINPGQGNFMTDTTGYGVDKGKTYIDYKDDLTGKTRTSAWDIGAYEAK